MLTPPTKLKKLRSPIPKGSFTPAKLCCLLVVTLLFGASPTKAAVDLQGVPGFEKQQHRDLSLFRSSLSAPTPTCNQPVNVCFDVDQSGSICCPSPNLCQNCGGSCCDNYRSAINFITAAVNGIENVTNGTYGFVTFATNATTVRNLTTSTDVINAVTTTPYTGGFSNTEAGFQRCQSVLAWARTESEFLSS
jgi:hypothetical protein